VMATKPLDALTDVLEPERPAARTDKDQGPGGGRAVWGAALLFHDDGHISFGLIVNSFSKQWQRRVTVGGYFLCMAFFLVVAYQSVILMIVLRGSVGISVPVPKSLVYSVILLSSITATLLLSFRTIKIYAGKD